MWETLGESEGSPCQGLLLKIESDQLLEGSQLLYSRVCEGVPKCLEILQVRQSRHVI